jgi:hypothetical protein
MKFSTGKVYHDILPTGVTALTEPVPEGEAIVVKSIFVTNTNQAESSSISLFVAPEGVTPSKAHSLLSNLKYSADEKENIHSLFVTLEPGDVLYGSQTTADAVVIYVSGVKQQVI